MKKFALIFMATCVMTQFATADIWEDLSKYKMSEQENLPPVQANKLITETPVSELGVIEDKLISILESKDSTPEAKWFSCRMLQRIGTEKCVPTLATLLSDDIMSHYARLTLERMTTSEKAGTALRDALNKAPDNLKPGLIGSIAERRDTNAISQIAKLAESNCEAVSKAALQALGKIGGQKTKEALEKVKVCDSVKSSRMDAMLVCAEGLSDAGMFNNIYNTAELDEHRAGALKGLLLTDANKGASIVVNLLKGDNSYLQDAAMRLIATTKGEILTATVAGAINEMPADRQAGTITLLGERGDRTALASVTKLTTSEDKSVRDAAIRATALLGNSDSASMLLTQAAASRDIAVLVVNSIGEMTDPDVNSTLINALKDDKVRAVAADALAKRTVIAAVPELKKLTSDSNEDTEKSVWSALGELGCTADLDELMKQRLSVQDQSRQKHANVCLKDICSREQNKNECIDIIGAYYENADESAKCLILDLAAIAGSDHGIALAKSALNSDNKILHDKAVRALAAWTGASAAESLLDLARNAPDEITRILALRGFIQNISKENNQANKLEKLQTAKALLKNIDDKRLFVAAALDCRDYHVIPLIIEFTNDAEVKKEARLALLEKARQFRNDLPKESMLTTLTEIINDAESTPDMIKHANDILNTVKN